MSAVVAWHRAVLRWFWRLRSRPKSLGRPKIDAEVRDLIRRLWTDRAVGVIGGRPKLGKSWLAFVMAVSIASGTPCLGDLRVHASGPVLLYAAEDSAAALRTRLETLARIRQLDFAGLDVRVITAESLRLNRGQDQGVGWPLPWLCTGPYCSCLTLS